MIEKALATGHEIEPVVFQLDAASVGKYVVAAGDHSEIYQTSNLVPPTAVVALGVRTMLGALLLPGGTVHLAQEYLSHRAVAIGERLLCSARIAQQSQRRDGTFLAIEFILRDENGGAVMEGRSTLMTPTNGA